MGSKTILLAMLVVLLLLCVTMPCRPEGFVSARAEEVYRVSKEMFDHGEESYSAYKVRLGGVDAVTFTDVRRLWKEGRLTPEAVQGALPN